MKLLGTVSMNNREALVVDSIAELSYRRVNHRGYDLLIGSNEDGIYHVFYHRAYRYGPKAFGGAKIRWHLDDGSILESDGWWWSGGEEKAEDYLGKKLISVSIECISELVGCFVFTGMLMDRDKAYALFNGVPETSRFLSYNDSRQVAYAIKKRLSDERVDPYSVDPAALWSELLRGRDERLAATPEA